MKRKKRNKSTVEVAAPRPSGKGDEPTAPTEPAKTDDSAANDKAIDSVRKELESAKDKLLRAMAEQQNIQKRSAQQLAEAVRYANADLTRSLLGVVDDFERTLEHAAGTDVDTVLRGLQLIYDNFLKILKDHRVEVIDPVDQAFDPRYHEALLSQPASGKEPGSVIQVVQRGYRLEDRVLRPAKVIIASSPEDGCVDATTASDEACTPTTDEAGE